MSDTSTPTADPAMADQSPNAGDAASAEATATVEATLDAQVGGEPMANFSERYSEVIGRVNELLDQVDWSQMGRIGKAVGILVVVIVAQVLIKGVLDTINLLPIVPGLLELLGLVVVGHWSWKNLTTSDKRQAVVSRLQTLKSEYLG